MNRQDVPPTGRSRFALRVTLAARCSTCRSGGDQREEDDSEASERIRPDRPGGNVLAGRRSARARRSRATGGIPRAGCGARAGAGDHSPPSRAKLASSTLASCSRSSRRSMTSSPSWSAPARWFWETAGRDQSGRRFKPPGEIAGATRRSEQAGSDIVPALPLTVLTTYSPNCD